MRIDHQLTDWVKTHKEIEFAIDQLYKHGGKPFEVRSRGNEIAVFVEQPISALI